MNQFVTPKQVSRAIQVSESSVKRWCDKGVIPSQKTAGGHRRIPLAGLLVFLRESKQPLVSPEVIGLPATTGQSHRVINRAAQQLTEALIRGDDEQCRSITFDLFLAEHSVGTICDHVFAPAFQEIGNRWECKDAEVYQERLGCSIALRVLHELRSLIPPPPEKAPIAIGGAVEGDQYHLPTSMVELVLRDAKWNAVSLGSNLPFQTLGEAIKTHHPQLFWLSASHVADESRFLSEYVEFYEEFGMNVAIVVGGRALTEPLRQLMKYAAFCDNMQHLESFAQTLQGASERKQ